MFKVKKNGIVAKVLAVLGGAGTHYCIAYMAGQMQAYGLTYGVGLEWFGSRYFSPSIVVLLIASLAGLIVGVISWE